MVLKKWQKLIDDLEETRIKKEGGKGTIWITYDEFEKVSDYFEGQMVSPGGAAGDLRVSRAMIHQLERDGKIRAYRMIVDDKTWDRLPFHIRLLTSKKLQYIWIPVDDLVEYAQKTGKGDLPFVKYHLELKKEIAEFYSKQGKTRKGSGKKE